MGNIANPKRFQWGVWIMVQAILLTIPGFALIWDGDMFYGPVFTALGAMVLLIGLFVAADGMDRR